MTSLANCKVSVLRFARFAPLQARLERVWVGTFMTSLDMRGLSLSLIRLNDGLTKLLDAPAKVVGWEV